MNIESPYGYLRTSFALWFFHQLSIFQRNRLLSKESFCELLASLSYHEVDDGKEKIKKNNNSCNNENKNSERAAQLLAEFFALSNLIGIAIQLKFQLDPPISALVTSELHCRHYTVNQCSETNRVHHFACSIETFNSFEILFLAMRSSL